MAGGGPAGLPHERVGSGLPQAAGGELLPPLATKGTKRSRPAVTHKEIYLVYQKAFSSKRDVETGSLLLLLNDRNNNLYLPNISDKLG